MTWDDLPKYLLDHGVGWSQLDHGAQHEAENNWREIFGAAFTPSSPLKSGSKAEYCYSLENCIDYLVIPFTSDVPGTPMHVRGKKLKEAYRCSGKLVALGDFCDAEFFVCPLDYSWTMVHTHEDCEIGGPYFLRRKWVPDIR